MHTTSQTILAALGLAAILGVGGAYAQDFPGAAIASRTPVGSVNTPSAGVSQFAEFPRSVLPSTVPSVSDRVPVEAYDLMVQFPRSAMPTGYARASLGGTGQNR